MPEHPHGMSGAIGFAGGVHFLPIHVAEIGVGVRIDEAGHESAASDVDDLSIVRLDRLTGHLAYEPVLDQDIHSLGTLGAEAVEYAGILKQYAGHLFRGLLLVFSISRRSIARSFQPKLFHQRGIL